jgi:hypothetical protein
MSVAHVEVIVEEPSMEAVLRIILPAMLGATTFRVYPHQCKDEMLQRLPQRLSGYKNWLPPDWRILVLVDRDDDDCQELKSRLERVANAAGIVTKSISQGRPFAVINRLVVEELEAWYFGNWDAVKAAYPRVPSGIPQQAKYRDPDAIRGGTWEAFERVLQRAGYFRHGLRQLETARSIAAYMKPERNSSHSFCLFRDAMRDIAS